MHGHPHFEFKAVFRTVRVFCPIRVWDNPYVYGMTHTRMGSFPVPYAYGHPVLWISCPLKNHVLRICTA